MPCATAICSTERLLTFDRKAGENLKPILCICPMWLPQGFITDLEASKIVMLNTEHLYGYKKGQYSVWSFLLTPLFGYDNQKLEDLFFELFIKYDL